MQWIKFWHLWKKRMKTCFNNLIIHAQMLHLPSVLKLILSFLLWFFFFSPLRKKKRFQKKKLQLCKNMQYIIFEPSRTINFCFGRMEKIYILSHSFHSVKRNQNLNAVNLIWIIKRNKFIQLLFIYFSLI